MSTDTQAGSTHKQLEAHNKRQYQLISTLCIAAGKGDKMAENQLFKYIYPKLKQALSHSVWDKSAVEDICHETLEIALRKLRQGAVKDSKRFFAFLLGISRNVLAKHLREKQKKLSQYSLEEAELSQTNRHHVQHRQQPIHELEEQVYWRIIRSCMEKMHNQRDRDVLINFYIYGFKRDVLCKQLELNPEHLHRVLYRAKNRLKKSCLARQDWLSIVH